jgi:hypothetical protein
MQPLDDHKHEFYEGAVLDVDRHAGNQAPSGPVPKPQVGASLEVNTAVANGACFQILSLFILTAFASYPYVHI